MGQSSPLVYPDGQRLAETGGANTHPPWSQPFDLQRIQRKVTHIQYSSRGENERFKAIRLHVMWHMYYLSYSKVAGQDSSVASKRQEKEMKRLHFHCDLEISIIYLVQMWAFTCQQSLQQAQYFQQQSRRSASSNKRNKMRGSNHRRLAGGQSEGWSWKVDNIRNTTVIQISAARDLAGAKKRPHITPIVPVTFQRCLAKHIVWI